MHVHSPPCPARRAVSRGVAWPPTLSPSLGPWCVLVAYVDDVVADILSSLCSISPPNGARFSFFGLIFNLAFAFYFPLSGGNRDGTTSAKREILWCFNVCEETTCFFKNEPQTLCIFARAHSCPRPGPSEGCISPTRKKIEVQRGKLWSHFTIIWYLNTKTKSSFQSTHNN